MTTPALRLTSERPIDSTSEVLVIGVSGGVLLGVGEEFAVLEATLASIGSTCGVDEIRRLPAIAGAAASLALVGFASATPTPDELRYAAGTAARLIRGAESITLAFPVVSDAEALAVLEGAAIGAYRYTTYRSTEQDAAARLATEIVVIAPASASPALLARAAHVAEAVHTVRDLVNMPASDLYPESFATAAVELCAGLPLEVTVLAEDALAAEGFGGILGVGQGSTRGPRLVKVSYAPDGASRHLAIVGKGITFDTGGLSLKPPTSMVGMKYDMTGAATALAVVIAAARLEVPVRLTAWLCLAENMPSGNATRPGDVLTMKGGRTVEVLNTDAEGRLVLADGIVAASQEEPDAIIDVATLTGAAIVAMGNRYVATMGEDALVARVVAAAGRVGEPFWPMPLPGELRALLDSDIADLANVKIGNTAGGMLIAAIFLREFVGRTADDPQSSIPWAHLDIAGAASNGGGAYGFTGKGPTGAAVRALLEVAEDFSRG